MRSATSRAAPLGLVQAFMPGEEGGAAIAGVLSGRISPGGKLPVQIPRRPGGQPRTYLQPPLGSAESAGISSVDPTPLFPFGYGASYTTFEIDDLRLSSTEVPTDGEFEVSVRVRNTGARAGDEVVQLYLHDVVAQVARPVKQLAGFARVTLEPGDAVDVRFRVHADRTAYTDRELERIVEPGDIEVLVGNSSASLPCRGKVRLTGETRVVGRDRQLTTPVDLTRAREPATRNNRLRLEGRVTTNRRADHPRHDRVGGGRVGGHGVQGGQRPPARLTDHPRARSRACSTKHEYVARRARHRPAFRSVELVFHLPLTAYSLEILHGVVMKARTAPSMLWSPCGGAACAVPPRVRSQWVRQLAAAGRQAVIAVVSEMSAADIAALARVHMPIVVIDPINMPRSRVISVGSTNFTGGFTATQHLLDLGHRRIAYIGGPATAACNQARMHGYRSAMEAAGAPITKGYVRNGRFRYGDGLTEGAALLALGQPPTAIFAANDETALGVLEAARTRGLRIPEDLSVVGFDDTEVARLASPPLTAVAQPLRKMGAVALRTALRLAAGERVDSHHVELATELVVRDSTAPPPDAR